MASCHSDIESDRTVLLRKEPRVSNTTRKRVIAYHWSQRKVQQRADVEPMLRTLPIEMRRRLALDRYGVFLAKFHLFTQGPLCNEKKKTRTHFMTEMCSAMTSRFYIPRSLVIAQGLPFEGMLCTISGELFCVEGEILSDDPLAVGKQISLARAGTLASLDRALPAGVVCSSFVAVDCLFGAVATPVSQDDFFAGARECEVV